MDKSFFLRLAKQWRQITTSTGIDFVEQKRLSEDMTKEIQQIKDCRSRTQPEVKYVIEDSFWED